MTDAELRRRVEDLERRQRDRDQLMFDLTMYGFLSLVIAAFVWGHRDH